MSARPPASGAARMLALAGLLCALPLGSVAADLRVLLAFDASGHRVHRVTRVDAEDRGVSSYTPPAARAAVRVPVRGATLTWLDRDGRTLAVERAPDPRVSHVPVSGNEASAGANAALSEGGWLVQGPGQAATLLLRLPAREAPALSAEEWRLNLETGDSSVR